MALKIGSKAPDFTLTGTSGTNLQLSRDLKGKELILFFYPKAFAQIQAVLPKIPNLELFQYQ